LKSEIVQIAGLEVEYAFSKGKEETVVLVNGSGGPLISWSGIFDALSTRYNVLAYNRPGIGKSSRAQSAQTATQMAHDLEKLMEFLSIHGSVTLVGHSLGGLVVLQFCIDFPHRTKGIVLLEPSTVWDIMSQKSLPNDKRYKNSELNHVRDSVRKLEDLSLLPKVPTLIGIGMKSSLLYWIFRPRFEQRRSNLRRLSNQIADSEMVGFTKSGHFPQFSESKKVTEMIAAVVQKTSI